MRKKILYHTGFWMTYVLFKSYINLESELAGITLKAVLKVTSAQFVFLLVKIPMVYILFYMIEQFLAKRWRLLRTATMIITLFTVSIGLFMTLKKYIVLEEIYKTPGTWKESLNFSSILQSFFILAFTGSVAATINLVRTNIRQREAEQEILKGKLETELRFLKAQINPHFLFNTLNNIYALARKKSADTPDVVMKLSRLFRFILYESEKPLITIEEEILVLDNYIELESIRYNGKLQYHFNRSVDDPLQLVAPLILLPFVENCFKHGVSESRFNSYIHIDLVLKEKKLWFTCENSKADQSLDSSAGSIGLGNIKRQLELLYPGHSMIIKNADTFYKMELKIELDSPKTMTAALAKHATIHEN